MTRQIDASTLVVNELVAHRVPRLKGDDDPRQIQFSASVPDLPPETHQFFARRLKGTFGDAGQHVEIDDTLEAPRMPQHLRAHLTADEPDLLEFSKHAAQLLQEAQGASRWEDESLVAVMGITLDGKRGVAVAKLEQEEGVEFEEKEVDGGTTLMVAVNDRLLLTDNTRVFKAAAYRIEDHEPVGVVCDVQQGHPSDLARYFLQDFLGSRHQVSPARTTKDFVGAVETYASTHIPDPDDKLTVDYALRAELTSNRSKIAPAKFVQAQVPASHQAGVLDAIQEAGVPTTSFDKDDRLLGRRPRRTKLMTSLGITIAGPAEAMHERVTTAHDGDGESVLVVRDRLTKVG